MRYFICRTCGVQHAAAASPPRRCRICEDERQYVGWQGQRWTTLDELRAEGLHSDVRRLEPDLLGIGVTPSLGIGQRGLLVRGERGNVLWDCAGYVDQEAIDQVRELGGLAAVSASHPHFYGCVVEWSQAFGGAPIYLPRADGQWIMRPDPAVRLWEDRLEIDPGITLLRCGGHFEGSAVLHWAAGAEGRGALLVGDTIQVVRDRRFVSFMRSYPNLIPLPASAITRIAEILEPLRFDRVYGGWWDLVVRSGAAEAVRASAARYVAWVRGGAQAPPAGPRSGEGFALDSQFICAALARYRGLAQYEGDALAVQVRVVGDDRARADAQEVGDRLGELLEERRIR